MLQITDVQLELIRDMLDELEGHRADVWPYANLVTDGEEELKELLANHLKAKQELASFDPQI